jgi:hypothetical protein
MHKIGINFCGVTFACSFMKPVLAVSTFNVTDEDFGKDFTELG